MSNLNVYSKSSRVKVLVCVLGAGIGAAAIIMIAMLQYYNPAGIYFANNVLLSPKTFSLFQTDSTFKKNQSKIAFDRFEFKSDQGLKTIDQQSYFYFYDLAKSDGSIKNPEESVINAFSNDKVAVLTLYGKDMEKPEDKNVVLTQIDFLQDDYYRVRLLGSSEAAWVYFYHPGIYKLINAHFL